MDKNFLPSFARRLGRSLSSSQQSLLDNLLPLISFSMERFEELRAQYQNINMEIGFGGGEHIFAQAERNHDALYIGCEPYLNGVVKLLGKIKAADLKNVLIHTEDARELLKLMPDNILDSLFILFPDPWPKNKQKKRRIINVETLAIFNQKLKAKGRLIVATDHKDYAKHILVSVASANCFTCPTEELSSQPPENWVTTRYETKGRLAGSKIHYFLFMKS